MSNAPNNSNLDTSYPIPRRPLGKTGEMVSIFALGGEGVLRTHDRKDEAIAVINEALDQGVNYCDTAPAYASSMDYYGAALGERRKDVFLACKTHDRTRDGSLRLLDDILNRLKTDHLDLWQLHDLRTLNDLDTIFAPGGALEALLEAREDGRVRYLGITGHQDPEMLLEAMRRFNFDTALMAINVADVHRLSFIEMTMPEAIRQQMGVIGMKVVAQGVLLKSKLVNMQQAMSYVLSVQGVSTAVIGCSTPEEVRQNAEIARNFVPLEPAEMRRLEEVSKEYEAHFTNYKRRW